MAKNTCFSIYRSIKAYMTYNPLVIPAVILHYSCVLEDEEELKKLVELLTPTDSEYKTVCKFFIMKDTSYELNLLAKYSNIPSVKRNADFILKKLCPDDKTIKLNTNELYVKDDTDEIPINRIIDFRKKAFMCFYSAAAAEEFVNAAKYIKNPNFCILYYNVRYVSDPFGAAKLYTVPTPLTAFTDSTPYYWRFRDEPKLLEQLTSSASAKTAGRIYHNVPEKTFSEATGNIFGGRDFKIDYQNVKKVSEAGKEGLIYEADGSIIKLYRNTKSGLEDKIRYLAAFEGFFGGKIVFPKGIIYDENGTFAGFSMRKAGGTDLVKCSVNYDDDSAFRISDKSNPDFRITLWKNVDRRKVLREIIVLLLEIRLFDMDCLDLSMRNILADKNSDIHFIDSNSFQADGFTSTLMPQDHHPDIPEKTKWYREQKYTDFSLAALLFRCMLHNADPSDPDEDSKSGFINSNEPFHYKINDTSAVNDIRPIQLSWLALDERLRKTFCRVFNFEAILTPGEWIEVLQQSANTSIYDQED